MDLKNVGLSKHPDAVEIVKSNLTALPEVERKELSKTFHELTKQTWGEKAWTEEQLNEHLEKYPSLLLAKKDNDIVGFITFNEKRSGTILVSKGFALKTVSKSLIEGMFEQCPEVLIEFPISTETNRFLDIYGKKLLSYVTDLEEARRGFDDADVAFKKDPLGRVYSIKETRRGLTEKRWILKRKEPGGSTQKTK